MKLPIDDKNFGPDGRFKGGVREAAKMLSGLGPELQEKIIHFIEVRDPETAEEIRTNLICFEDLQYLSRKDLAALYKLIDMDKLGLGLRLASDPTKATVYETVSEAVRKDLDFFVKGEPRKKSDVLAAQEHVLSHLKELVDRGTIEIIRDDDDEIYV